MNDPAQLTEGDKFGLKLDYNMATSPGTAMFNGNISGFTWSTATLNQARYVYTYDDQNRMTYANYASTQDAGSFNVSVAYNANGNITYLQRKSSGIASDNLDFTYRGNRVTGIRDLAQDKPMVIDYPGGTTFYPLVYDSSGNVVLEPHKQLEIRYNLHNLPSEIIRIGQNQRIRYYYTFDGLKLARQYEDNGTVTGTYYCGPFVYETVSGVRSLKYILTPHGRAVKNGSLWTREFNLRDHLGNVRVVIRKGGNGQAEIVQQKGYYPFGGEISQFSTGTGTNRHWYNGKELQDDLNLYWYDYGARFYDPELARWHTIDNKAEKYYQFSPYVYAANNPIRFIDPDGNDWWDTVVGTAIGLATNIVPGSTSLRNSYTPTDAADYNNALRSTDAAAMTGGGIMVKGGGGAAATGLATAAAGGTLSLTGVGAVVGAPAAGIGLSVAEAGAATALGGTILMANSSTNAAAGYKYGQDGTQTPSKTVWKEKGSSARIDVENPNPGQRDGQIHYQDANGNKYMYDPNSNSFKMKNTETGKFDVNAPKKVNNLLNDEKFMKGIDKAKKYLGE